jgi:hypothetical protein
MHDPAVALAVGLLGVVLVVLILRRVAADAFGNEDRGDDPEGSPQPWGSGVGPPPGQPGTVIRAEDLPPVLTRTYTGKPNEVEILRSVDAEALEGRGYFPSSQSYIEGRWSGGAWVLAFLALIFLVGILILAYMIAAKPAGTLTVIYERRLAGPAVAVSPASDIEARLATLERLRSTGAISEEEFAARRNKILDEV